MPMSLSKSFCRSADDASKQLRDFAYQWYEERIEQAKAVSDSADLIADLIATYTGDCDDMLKIVDALTAGEIGRAHKLCRDLDTFVRELVPDDVIGFLALHSTAGMFIGMLPDGQPANSVEQFASEWMRVIERLETATHLQCVGFYPDVSLGFYTSSGDSMVAMRCDGEVALRLVTMLENKTAAPTVTA